MKFSSAKNFVKSYRREVRQEFIFVKRRSSLVCSVDRLVATRLLFAYLPILEYLCPTLVVL